MFQFRYFMEWSQSCRHACGSRCYGPEEAVPQNAFLDITDHDITTFDNPDILVWPLHYRGIFPATFLIQKIVSYISNSKMSVGVRSKFPPPPTQKKTYENYEGLSVSFKNPEVWLTREEHTDRPCGKETYTLENNSELLKSVSVTFRKV